MDEPVLETSPAINSILSAIPNPVVAMDCGGVVRLCNEAFLSLLGHGAERVMGRPVNEFIEDGRLSDIPRTGREEAWHRFSLGGRVFLVSRAPLYIEKHLAGTLAVLHEISQMEQISNDLKSVRLLTEELEGIIETAFDGIYVTDGKGVTLRVNDSYQRITGLKRGDLIGRSMYELVERGIFNQSVSMLVLQSGKPCSLIQTISNGVTVLASANPLFDTGGAIVRVVTAVRDITELNRLRDELDQADKMKDHYKAELSRLRRDAGPSDLIAQSAAMRHTLDLALRVGAVDSTVLITGESGAGKEEIAAFIHNNSRRCDKIFLKINCAAIPEHLLESELFGYVRGAFTGASKEGKAGLFETAHGGTLLLDEIGDLPLGLQAKLLRVIQEKQTRRVGSNASREVDVRILAATNMDLAERVKRRLFREDLYYRLNVVPIEAPPLRQRKEDIPILAHAFLQRYCKRYNLARELHQAVMPGLLEYPWPGNVRELMNLLERLVVTCRGRVISPEDLPASFKNNKSAPPDGPPREGGTLKEMLLRAEADIFKATLSRCATTREAARALGVNQSTVVRKARLHGLTLRTAPEGSGRGPARKKGRGNARTAGIARLG